MAEDEQSISPSIAFKYPVDKKWLEFFGGEKDPEDEEWVRRDFPGVEQARTTMSRERFATWFIDWLADYRESA